MKEWNVTDKKEECGSLNNSSSEIFQSKYLEICLGIKKDCRPPPTKFTVPETA